jgi:peptidoglycan/LPS O-acetylase OafA/YrhL
MSQRLLSHLGHISYSTFCIHLVVLYGVEAMLDYQLFSGDTLLIWVLTLVLSLVASEILYRFVEKPGLRLKEIRRRRRESSESPQTSTTAATTK